MEISVNANEKKYFDNPNLKYLSAKKYRKSAGKKNLNK